MTNEVLHNIATSLQQSPDISLMMDETTYVSNHEQATIVLLHVTKKMEVLEKLIDRYVSGSKHWLQNTNWSSQRCSL